MGLFYSPMELIGLIKDSKSIAQELNEKEHDADWYFSKEGEKAYNNAKTPAQKTMYFFDYLLAVSKSRKNRDILYRTAFIMANSMDSSSLEFAGYPNILDSAKNPLIHFIKTNDLNFKEKTACGLMMLAILNHENDATKYLHAKYKPYTRLTYCEVNGSIADKYKIERDIIGVFCTDFSGQYMPPYIYDIVDSSNEDD